MHRVIEVYPYNKTKVRVKLDSGFTFALYKGEILKNKIKEDEYLSDETVEKIVEEILKKRAKERALYLIKDMSKTKKQISDKLAKDYYPQCVIDYVIDFLEEYSFVDDYEYACHYVQAYSSRKSIAQIKNDLYKKGIDKSLADIALSENEIDEDSSIVKLIEKNKKKYDLMDVNGKRKFYAMLMRKGYAYDCINRALNLMELI
ncbi:MAG: regulatory protein RecX [Lachnospiraceae bacterium]|nr:regulatory protein RecX [Lachnospiraceae bacterium]